MSWVTDIFSSGIDKVATAVTNGLDNLFTSDEEKLILANKKLEIEAAVKTELTKMENEFNLKVDEEFNRRTLALEGTASDLKAIPILGSIVLFFRGMQRVIIGYGTMYVDFNVFSGLWKLQDDALMSAFWIINFLVFGFLFGERTLKNVLPIAIEFFRTVNKNKVN